MEHTQLPWRSDGGAVIEDASGRIVACLLHDMCPEQTVFEHCQAEAYGNRDFIVRSCNAHDELLAACEELVRSTEVNGRPVWDFPRLDAAVRTVKAAIAKATKGPRHDQKDQKES